MEIALSNARPARDEDSPDADSHVRAFPVVSAREVTEPAELERPAEPVPAAGEAEQPADTNAPEPVAQAEARSRGAAAKVGGFVLLLLLGTLAWQVASDLVAPASKTGSVAALTAQIAPRVSGQVVEVFVSDNQYVKRGDPLFAIDPKPFDLVVRQAEAALSQAILSVDASTVSLAAAEAQVEQAKVAQTNTDASTERTLTLFRRGLATQAQVDAANAQSSSARLTLNAAIAQLEGSRMQLGDSARNNPQVQAAQVQLDQARLNREFATVVAPVDGVITNLRMAVGQFLAAGTPALTFIESGEPWIVVDLRENQLANVDVGDPVRVLFDAVPGRTFEGRVRGVAWGIDPGRTAANGLPQNQASTRWFEPARTIPVQVELLPDEKWPANVRVGSKATALVYAAGEGNVVSVVASAIQTVRSYLSYLY